MTERMLVTQKYHVLREISRFSPPHVSMPASMPESDIDGIMKRNVECRDNKKYHECARKQTFIPPISSHHRFDVANIPIVMGESSRSVMGRCASFDRSAAERSA